MVQRGFSKFRVAAHAKVAADAVIARLTGRVVKPERVMASTCYSFISDTEAMHVASVHKYDTTRNTLVPVPGAGGLSDQTNAQEGRYAEAWVDNIWADILL